MAQSWLYQVFKLISINSDHLLTWEITRDTLQGKFSKTLAVYDLWIGGKVWLTIRVWIKFKIVQWSASDLITWLGWTVNSWTGDVKISCGVLQNYFYVVHLKKEYFPNRIFLNIKDFGNREDGGGWLGNYDLWRHVCLFY